MPWAPNGLPHCFCLQPWKGSYPGRGVEGKNPACKHYQVKLHAMMFSKSCMVSSTRNFLFTSVIGILNLWKSLSTWPGKFKVKTIIDSDLSHLTGTPSIQKPNGNVLLGSLLWPWQKDRKCCRAFGVSPATVKGLSPASWFHPATAEQISWGKSICKVSTKVWSVGKCFKCTFAGNSGGQGLLLLNFLCKSLKAFCPCEMPSKFSKPSA